jgi:hypothetical protein
MANATSFQKLAAGVGTATFAFGAVYGAMNLLPDTVKPIIGIATAVVGALTAITVGAMAAAGALSWGTAIPVILGAVGAGVAAITAMIPKADSGTASSTTSVPALQVPQNYAIEGSTSMITNNSPSVADMEQAVYNGYMAAQRDSGGAQGQEVVVRFEPNEVGIMKVIKRAEQSGG